MGLFDRFRRRETEPGGQISAEVKTEIIVGANGVQERAAYIQAFENGRFTWNGELSTYDYTSILQDKQNNILSLYQLSDYYSDADPLVHAIIYQVYVPFCAGSTWYLSDAPKKTIKLFEDYYKYMRLREKMTNIFLEFIKYNNVVCYIMDGQLITLPIHKCRFGNTMLSGQPIVEYDVQSIANEIRFKGYSVDEKYVKDSELDYILKGYPPEIRKAIKKGEQYAQMNPENTFVLQGSKEMWVRYAIPWIAAALDPLSRKELIKTYEKGQLTIGKKPFVHVKYGDLKTEMLPDREQLIAVRNLFKSGMQGFPLVVTNHLASASIVQANLSDLYQWPIYSSVNKDILTAGGISDAIASGESDSGSTFSLGQVAKETAEARIDAMRDDFCEMMNRVNERLVEFIPGTYNLKEIPQFHFTPLDMSGKKALREACNDLWAKGCVSTRTMMEKNGYSLDLEKELREEEAKDGTDKILVDRQAAFKSSSSETNNTIDVGKVGRPVVDESERTSDPAKSESGKQPKPSNPDGSQSS